MVAHGASNVLASPRMHSAKQRLEWIAVNEGRWELRAEQGRKLGALVKFEPDPAGPSAGHTWAALPRGGNYLEPKEAVREAALMLLGTVADPASGSKG